METTKRTMVLLSMVLLITGTVQSAEKPSKARISNTRFASCVVKITANPAILPLNYETIESLLHSSSIAGKAGREVLGLSLDQSVDLFFIEPLSRDFSGDIPPESTRGPRRMSEEMMMEDTMMEEELELLNLRSRLRRSGAGIVGGVLGDAASPRSRRGRTGRVGGLYGEEDSRTSRRPRVAISAPPRLAAEQTILFRLTVELPEDVKPAAEEFMSALIDNLRSSLSDAFNLYRNKLRGQLQLAETQRDEAQSQLSEIMERARAIEPPPLIQQDPVDLAVYEQLKQIVDLSQLTPETPFAEAVGILKNSVDPPLKIVVLWRDLLENVKIEPTTAINMDGIPEVRLGTALELLLKAVSDGFTELGYVTKNGVITIATADSDLLPSNLETKVYDIPSLGHPAGGTDYLIQLIQDTIEPDSWFDYGGEGTIGTYLGKKLAILQTIEIHRKIQDFLRATKIDIPIDIPSDIPVEPLLEEKHNLLREKRGLEMEVARLEARHIAIEEQIKKISEQAAIKVKDDPVTVELQGIVDMYAKQYEQAEAGRMNYEQSTLVKEKLAKTRIELAKRREELGQSAGGDQVARFNRELADIMIELAEKRAELGVVDKQLGQTERQLIMATTFDPRVSQIRLTKQALEIADRRVSELETLLAGLQPPIVTALGAD